MAAEASSKKYFSPAPQPLSAPPKPQETFSPPQYSSPSPKENPKSQNTVRIGGGGGSSGAASPSPSPIATTPERSALLSGQTIEGGQAVRNLPGGGRIKSPIQNIQGGQYIIGQGLRSRVIQQDAAGDFMFSQSATPDQRKAVIGALRREGLDVKEQSGKIAMATGMNTPPAPKSTIASSISESALFSPAPAKKNVAQREFFSPAPPIAAKKAVTPRQTQESRSLARTRQFTSTVIPEEGVQFTDYIIGPGKDILRLNTPQGQMALTKDLVQQKKTLVSQGLKADDLRTDILAGLSASTNQLRETRKLGEKGTRQTQKMQKEFKGFTGVELPEPVVSAGLVTFLSADAALTTSGLVSGAGFLKNIGGVAAKEGVKRAGFVVGEKVVETLGSPVNLVKLVKKDINPATLKKAQIGLGLLNIGAVSGDIVGFKNEYGSGLRSEINKGVRYFTFQSPSKERASFVGDTIIYNAPYYGARSVQAMLPTGKASKGLELAYRGANLGVIGLLGAQNLQEAQAQGKGFEYALGKTVGELAIQEDLIESKTVDRLFEGTGFYKGLQKKAAADIVSGRKTPEYFDYFSSVDVPGSFSGFKGRTKQPGREGSFSFTKFVGEGGKGMSSFSMDLRSEIPSVKDAIKGTATRMGPTPRQSANAKRGPKRSGFSEFMGDIKTELVPKVRESREFADLSSTLKQAFGKPSSKAAVTPSIKSDISIRADTRKDITIRPDLKNALDIRPDMKGIDIRRDFGISRPEIRAPAIRTDLTPDIRPDFKPDTRPDDRTDIKPDFKDDRRSPLFPPILPGFLGDGKETGTTSRTKGKKFSAISQDLLATQLRSTGIFQRAPRKSTKNLGTLPVDSLSVFIKTNTAMASKIRRGRK